MQDSTIKWRYSTNDDDGGVLFSGVYDTEEEATEAASKYKSQNPGKSTHVVALTN